MHRFRVWAPKANRVSVKIGEQAFPLALEEDGTEAKGWWFGEFDAAETDGNIDYAFLLDDDPLALPDPRSAWQPNGVHNASRLLDHRLFQWSDAGWQAPPLSSAVIYELHIGTFTPEGTFAAAIDRLDALVELGITHVEIMPVAAWDGERGWGYDGVDLFAPQEIYGGPEGLKLLVNACHAKGLAALLDVIYNHLGPVGNYLQRFGPYFTHSHITPWGDAVNLEESGSTEVRRFLCDNALMWLRDYHFDGLRLDAIHAFIDRSSVHFLEQLSAEVKELEAALGRYFVLIAESDLNDPRVVMSRDAGGCGIDAQWSDDFHHALVTLITGDQTGYYSDFGTMADLAKALEEVFVYAGRYSFHRGKMHGRPVNDLPGWKFLGYAQNHDQVGNRARGERLGHLTTEGRTKIAAALVMTAPFVPMLFQGEEFNASTPFLYFTHHEDEELGKKVSKGRSHEFSGFGWNSREIPDPQSVETLQLSKLKWEEASTEPHASMLSWYKALIHLRRTTPDLTNGRMEMVKVDCDPVTGRFDVRRGSFHVLCNLGTQIGIRNVCKDARLILGSDPGVCFSAGKVSLPSDSVAILEG
jgi:maltooligosyltrehalose trehalohydrolase